MASFVVSDNMDHISASVNDLTSFSYLIESTMECIARMMTVLVPRSTRQSSSSRWALPPRALAGTPQSRPIRLLLLQQVRVMGS